MSTGVVASIVAPLLVFLAAVFGVYMKRRTERQAAIDAKAKEDKDRQAKAETDKLAIEAGRTQAQYETIKTDRDELREEVRRLRTEVDKVRSDMDAQMDKARTEAMDLWSKFAALRREMDAAEDHIADVHRWDETGRHGAMPQRVKTNG